MAYRVTIKSTRAIHSMQRGCLSVENTNGSLLEASLKMQCAPPEFPAHWIVTRIGREVGDVSSAVSSILKVESVDAFHSFTHTWAATRVESGKIRPARADWMVQRLLAFGGAPSRL